MRIGIKETGDAYACGDAVAQRVFQKRWGYIINGTMYAAITARLQEHCVDHLHDRMRTQSAARAANVNQAVYTVMGRVLGKLPS